MADDIWELLGTLRVSEDDGIPPPVSSLDSCERIRENTRKFVGKKKSNIDCIEHDNDACEYCSSKDIVLEDGNYFCKSCNSITNRFIDSNAEWRYYGAEDSKSTDPTRCGMPINSLLPESSLGSVISNKMNESYDMRLIRKYHMWNSMSYKERSLYNIFDNITLNATNSGISTSIIEEAKMFYKKVSESKITRGDNRNGLIASSIYMSCKSNKVPRSTKEIAKMFNIKITTMTKGCKKFQDIMKMNLDSTKPEDFIQRFSSKLNLSIEIRDLCKYIVEKADELNIVSENTPPSIAAGSIYLCVCLCDIDITKKELSQACGISQVTLTKCYKKLFNNRAHLFPKEAIIKYKIK
jgi:transcription initiation factor TFIIB